MEQKKAFISGPMRGKPNNNKESFMDAEQTLRAAGFSVFNPAWLLDCTGFDDSDFMAIDLAALNRCNYIYQLEGWENSAGATAEWQAAKWAGIMPVNKAWLDWYTGTEMPEAMAKAKEEREHSEHSRLYAISKEARDTLTKEDLNKEPQNKDTVYRSRMGTPEYMK